MRILHNGIAVVIGALLLGYVVLPATAAVVPLGETGWQASWDSSLDGRMDIIASAVVGDAVFIEKFAVFNQPPVNDVIPPILIEFRQIAPTTINHFVIDDEILINSTGVTWTDFHMELVDPTGGTAFDPVATAASQGPGPIGWTIDPFTLAVFSGGNKNLDIWGGDLPPGSAWFPGNGAYNGQLWIDVTPTADNSASFVLIERPTLTGIPEPATLALLGIGGVALLRRRLA